MRVKVFIFTALILLAGIVVTSLPRATAQQEIQPSAIEQELLEIAANRDGSDPASLQVLKSKTVELPLTGRHVQIAKVLDTRDSRVLSAAMDEKGQEVDFAALKDAEEREHRARFGKLEPKLHQKIEGLRNDEKVRVAFWLNQTENLDEKQLRDPNTELTREEADAMLARRVEQVKAASSRATEGLANALLRAGHAVNERSETAPIVYATLPAGLVKQISERTDVQLTYLAEDTGYQDHMDIAAPSMKADLVWNQGITGVGGRIAIVEDSRVDFNNSCLPNNLGTRIPNDPEVDDHATACAGMAAGTNSIFRGIAPSAGIYSANSRNYYPENISAALDAAVANANVLNNSWGMGCGDNGLMDIHARHADYIVRYIWDTVTASAGNNGLCPGTEYVTSIGTAYNIITVGNYDDAGTVTSTDNVMNPKSSYKDPPSIHGDREKPEVAAPGTNITSTIMTTPGNCDTADVGSGTSYSAPMVAGLAADLIQVRPTLAIYPESMKALILAGARDNVEGAVSWSEKDGAGGVNALASYESAVNNRYRWYWATAGTFNSSGFFNIDMGWVNAGQRVKVALVWDSNASPGSNNYSVDWLFADLDLNVVGPGDVQWSSSWDNSYEIVDFTAHASGNFQIRVKKYRFDGSDEFFAVAWSL
jgi:hypothetical protein